MLSKINKFIDEKSFIIFNIFLVIGPILDCLTGILLNKNIGSLIFIFRILFLVFMSYYNLLKSKKSRKYMLFIFLYAIGFILTNLLFNNINIMHEIKSLIKTLYLPITLLFSYNVFFGKKYNEKYIYIALVIYLLLIFVPNIFNIGFESYRQGKLGSAGFFYSLNSVGSIISILTPLLLNKILENKNKLLLLIVTLIYVYILFSIGSKAPLMCFGIIIIYYLALLIINLLRKKKYLYILVIAVAILILILIGIFLVPKTIFYKNIIIHLNFLGVKKFTDLFTFKNFDHFIFSNRLHFLVDTFKMFIKSNAMQMLFGIGYLLNGAEIKTSEMDYFVTFIHQGVLGFIVIYYLYFKVLKDIIKKYFKNLKKNFLNTKNTIYFISVITSVLNALLCGHVLESPSAIIYVVIIMIITNNLLSKKVSK